MVVRPAALVSDDKRIRGVYARYTIQIDTFYFLPFLTLAVVVSSISRCILLQSMHDTDSIQRTCALSQEDKSSVLPTLELAAISTSDEVEATGDRDQHASEMEMETLAEVVPRPLPPPPESSSSVSAEMPMLERKDVAVVDGCVAGLNVPVESRSPSPPTLQHKDVIDTVPPDCEAEDSLLPHFRHPDNSSEEEEDLNEVN